MARPPEAARRRGTLCRPSHGLGVAVMLACLLLSASPAAAASIDQYIIADPVPGWVVVPPDQVQPIATELQNEFQNEGISVQVGLEAWAGQAPTAGVLVIAVIQLLTKNTAVSGAPASTLDGMCDSATRQLPTSTSAVVGVPDSLEGVCPGTDSSGYSPVTTVAFLQGNAVVLIQGDGISTDQVTGIAQNESGEIPAGGIPVPGSHTTLEIVGGVILVILLLVAYRIHRSRHPEPIAALTGAQAGGFDHPSAGPYAEPYAGQGGWAYPGQGGGAYVAPGTPHSSSPDSGSAARSRDGFDEPSSSYRASGGIPAVADSSEGPPEAGWYAVSGHQHHLRYWNGTSWISAKRWDGTQWQDTPDGENQGWTSTSL
ncbi:MAG: hypothetical protein ACRD0Z_02800 [Acidimicrobiales bacterium]